MSDADYIRSIAIKYEPMSHVIEIKEHRDRLNSIADKLEHDHSRHVHLLATANAMLPTFTTAESIGAWREMVRKWHRDEDFDFASYACYKDWYEEAMGASNAAGFAGVSAADTIRRLDFGKLSDDQALITKCEGYYDSRPGEYWPGLLTIIEQHIKGKQS